MRQVLPSLLIAALLTGCAAPQDELVGKPPAQARVEEQTPPTPPPQPDRPKYPQPRLVVSGWPYAEKGISFMLTWAGGNRPAPLHAEPDPNSPLLGDVVWDNGERVLWMDSVVATYQPRVIKATAEYAVEGPVYTEGYLTDEEFVQRVIAKGQTLEVWGYAGDGVCYLAQRSKIFTAPCPPPEQFTGFAEGKVPAEWYMPAAKIWWIRITGDNLSGWVPVDDRMIVDMVAE